MDSVRQVTLGYSLKNIPIPSIKEYRKRLIDRTEDVIKRMRWKAFFYLKGPSEADQKEKYGFRSRNYPPQVDELKAFEEDLYHMVENVEFRRSSDKFQDSLRKDFIRVKESNSIVVAADKTRNLYSMPADRYEKLLRDNITKSYRKAPEGMYDKINAEAKELAEDLELDDRMHTLGKAKAFVSLKDHKDNFADKLPCRLINPAKTEMGIVSKRILDGIVGPLRNKIGCNLWKNTVSVIEWFKSIEDKAQCSFVAFDIVDFYPSITKDLLRQALSYAQTHVHIQERDINIIMHARRSLLFDKEQAWMKKGESGEFDIAMGSYDGAEVCELVGTFILSKLAPLLNQTNVGLYRDDGLGVVRKAPGPVLDRLRKDIIAVFLSLGLKITIDINLLHVNYLDVAMSLASGTFGPYLKPNATPMYINASSNHPPQIIRNIPTSINKRLSQISSSKEVFDDAKRVYQDALTASGYDYTLEFSDGSAACPHKRRQRGRNVILYNPPYSKNVKTNIGGSFLRLIRKHFPKGSALGKLFNKNNVKISYSCTTNMASLIKKHNTTMLKPAEPPAQCNCRVKTSCQEKPREPRETCLDLVPS